MQRLIDHWVYGGFLAGFLLLGLTPVLTNAWSMAMILVYLQLPIYLLHQYEEHDADRFRRFTNEVLGKGKELLSKRVVFLVNIPGVWGINLASILLAAFVELGYGLIGIYLTLVNAVAHIGQGLALRRYNPGLITAVVLFLPVGGAGWASMTTQGRASLGMHAVGLTVAVGIHALIVLHVARRNRRPAAASIR